MVGADTFPTPRVAAVLMLVAALLVVRPALGQSESPVPAAADPDWLTYVNNYRTSAGLAALIEEPAWSAGDVLHAKYTVKENVLAHSENSSSPWYTADGALAAQNSNVMASSSTSTTDRYAIDLWMQGPFHAVGIIDPRLARTGFGSYRESDGSYQMAAAFDVLRGRSGSTSGLTWPILWPGPGKRVPIGSYGGNEYPNPLTSCPGYSSPSGLPIIAQFGAGSANPVVTASSMKRDGVAVEHCLVTESNYVNSDASAQSLGRSVLGARDAVVLIPRAPLVAGSIYTASVTVGGIAYTWSFSIGAFDDPSCTISLTPTSLSIGTDSAIRTIDVTATPSSCAWVAGSNAAWASITAGATGSGDGHVTVAITSNISTAARSATLTIGGRTVTITQEGQPAFTSDNDGLDDAWELSMGLSPGIGTGNDGPLGDPDGDGVSNQEEFAHGTHPRGFYTRYFAEGATIAQMHTRFALVNPNTTLARVVVRFTTGGGTGPRRIVSLPPMTRVTIDADSVAGLENIEFSTIVESDGLVVIDRTMQWNYGSPGSHAETAITAPANTWYLAEGATHSGFDLFYLLQNPSASGSSTVRVRYLRPTGAPLEKTYQVPASSRFNIWVDTELFPSGGGSAPLLDATDVSAVIDVLSGPPIIVERAMYLSRPGQPFVAGHEAAAVPEPKTRWFLAEGATGSFFDLFVLIANPTGQMAAVRATYLLSDGTTYQKTYDVPAYSRFNVWVDAESIPGHGYVLADASLSTIVESTNGVPVIVERAMWWPGPTPVNWTESHDSAGATETGTRWALAEGESGGPDQVETYVLIANTGSTVGEAIVTVLFEDETSAALHVSLLPNSRKNVSVGAATAAGGFGATVANRRFAILVESIPTGGAPAAPIVVERAMYSSPGGNAWTAGTNALATKLQ